MGFARERGHQGVVEEGEGGGRAGGRAERRERARAHFWVEDKVVGGGGVGIGNVGAKVLDVRRSGVGWSREDREGRTWVDGMGREGW